MARRKKQQPRTREQRALAAVRAAGGIDRAEHFAEGKTLAMWHHPTTVTKNGRRVASRTACRGRVDRDD